MIIFQNSKFILIVELTKRVFNTHTKSVTNFKIKYFYQQCQLGEWGFCGLFFFVDYHVIIKMENHVFEINWGDFEFPFIQNKTKKQQAQSPKRIKINSTKRSILGHHNKYYVLR